MGHYRKKPVIVEAVKWNGEVIVGGCPVWLAAVGEDLADAPAMVEPGRVAFCGDACFMGTLEGTMRADAGDWIIKGTSGELYPCKPDIFAAIYDPVDAASADVMFGVGKHEIPATLSIGRTTLGGSELTGGEGA